MLDRPSQSDARIVDRRTQIGVKGQDMTDPDYIAAYQKITDKYENNQSTMEDYLEAIKKLKEKFFKDNAAGVLPVVP